MTRSFLIKCIADGKTFEYIKNRYIMFYVHYQSIDVLHVDIALMEDDIVDIVDIVFMRDSIND